MNEPLRHIFSEVLRQPMPEWTDSTLFSDLPGWDSVAHLSLLLAIEKHFGCAFTSNEMVSMRCIGDMISILEKRNG